MTTQAAGEEGQPTTFAVGEEEPVVSTRAFGEEGTPVTTQAQGEEQPNCVRPTTRNAGEEGTTRPVTTYAVGEENSTKPVTTYAVGEENATKPVTTFAVGEENTHTSAQVGEEGSPTNTRPQNGSGIRNRVESGIRQQLPKVWKGFGRW